MNWIYELIELYKEFSPGFKTSVRGACELDIGLLEKYSKVKFPENYRNYLEVCGEKDGDVLANVPAFTDIKNLLITYEENTEFPDDFPEPPWFIVGAGHAGVDLIMNSETEVINESYGGDEGEFYAESFVKLVQQCAFKKFHISSAEHNFFGSIPSISLADNLSLKTDKEILSFVDEILGRDFQKDEILSDRSRYLYRSTGSFAFIEGSNKNGIMICLGGDQACISDIVLRVKSFDLRVL